MRRMCAVPSLLLVLSLILAGCGAPPPTPAPTAQPEAATATPQPTPSPDLLYVALIWHQHQPLYYKDPDTGVYTRPWVRVHATKDYYDMAAMLERYPDVHVTFNLTPVLMRQLDDIAAGARDQYWVLAAKPAAELSDDDKRYILERFFDANYDHVIARFPRYQELLDKRGGAEPEQIEAAAQSFSEQDYRDLQVWFNLAWFDPDFLAQAPLKALVEKGRGFSEDDKVVLFDKALEVVKGVIPLHKELQDAGQIEVTTTPYAHPILPLLYDSDLAAVGNPGAELPARFAYPDDARAQLECSVEVYEAHFGRAPRGLWPGEGAVAQEIVPLVAEAGYTWMASGETVLAKSRGIDGFTRDSADTVTDGDGLYRPYVVTDPSGAQVSMVFRDTVLSDKVGFTYSGMAGEDAAADFLGRLQAIQDRFEATLSPGPHLVSVILDGENAWENYENDGKAFLNALYEGLSESKTIKTVTPSEYLEMFPDTKVLSGPLFPGAWFSANYDTWIGEEEENLAWEQLRAARETLAAYDRGEKATTPEELAEARDLIYLAEGSDWFWWYGADQESGNDEYFDEGFRALLAQAYTALGEPVPGLLSAPIVGPRPAAAARQVSGLISPTVDGVASPAEEWAKAGLVEAAGGAMARGEDVLAGLYYGIDGENLYLRADGKGPWDGLQQGTLGFYVKVPGAAATSPFSQDGTWLGMRASHLLQVPASGGAAKLYTAGADGSWQPAGGDVVVGREGNVIEVAAPLAALGELQAGDDLRLVVAATQQGRDLQLLPEGAPAQLILPDLGMATIMLTVDDPRGDDNGPGAYTYPTDGVFDDGAFDIKQFTVGYDEKNLAFKFVFYGPVLNPWNSGVNLSIQTLDVYIDADPGAGTGNRLLLPGRNAALAEGNGWDLAVWAEGWTPGLYTPDANGTPQKQSLEPKIIVDAGGSAVTIRLPLAALGEGFDPATAGYAGVVLGQEGYPSPGVWRVRNVSEQAEQWRFGGAPADTNHTRIIDVAWPEGATPTQAEFLSDYPASQESNMDKLTADDLAQVPLLTIVP